MSSSNSALPIGITSGDPCGIGPEVALHWWAEQAAMGSRPAVHFFGPHSWLESLNAIAPVSGTPVAPASWQPEPGRPDERSSHAALEAMEAAAAAALNGDLRAVVTGPVHKARLAQDAGFGFAGQTEFFAARWGGDPVMAFAGGQLRVVLATWHLPLREVPAALTPATLKRAVSAAHQLCHGLGKSSDPPRIGVCGLNPHAGEDGLLGSEEKDSLNPILEELRTIHPNLSPCLPADTLFYRALHGEFDVVIALYHDQGLAPLKTVEFDEAANITLGLPYMRTSPDHGTGFEIAGKGTARPGSFARAVALAEQLSLKVETDAE